MGEMNPFEYFICGGFGGICTVLVGHPLDTIKVRLQTMPIPAAGMKPMYAGTWDCMKKTVKLEGFRGLYKGMGAPLAGVAPIFAISFMGYGVGKQIFGNKDGKNLSTAQYFLAGAFSGIFTTSIMAPGERIKCLLQIQQGTGKKIYNGPIDCAVKLYKQGGIRSIYLGSLATIMRGYYSLLYDETTNKASQKELQIKILFWSDLKNEVMSRHLQSFFIQHATAKDIVNCINNAITNCKLNIHNLIMLGSDGPNVNKKVFRTFSDELIMKRGVGLVDIGSCNLHIINNAFLKGLDVFGVDVVDLVVAVKYFFKDRPSRLSDYEECQKKVKVPRNRFIKHVATRWLTLEPAANRIIEQLPAMKEYFLKYIPTKCAYLEKTNSYKNLKNI